MVKLRGCWLIVVAPKKRDHGDMLAGLLFHIIIIIIFFSTSSNLRASTGQTFFSKRVLSLAHLLDLILTCLYLEQQELSCFISAL